MKLWTIIWLACGFSVCVAVSYWTSGDMLGGMSVGCEWWCAPRFLCVCVSYGCGFRLFTGPPSTLDYLFNFIKLGF